MANLSLTPAMRRVLNELVALQQAGNRPEVVVCDKEAWVGDQRALVTVVEKLLGLGLLTEENVFGLRHCLLNAAGAEVQRNPKFASQILDAIKTNRPFMIDQEHLVFF